jgi:predicted lipid-binding transport protein (Tim44 family)
MKISSAPSRFAALALSALLVGVTFAPLDADARAGRSGSFGSRGSKTFSAPPPTATAPSAAPIQRSVTQPNAAAPSPGVTAAQQRRPGLFGGGLGAGLMGGLLGAGLFGLLSGAGLFGGLGSLASIVGLLLQVALIFLVVRFALNWYRRRQQQGTPALQGAGYGRTGEPGPNTFRRDAAPGAGFSFGGSGAAPQSAPKPAPLTLDKSDFDDFERLLSEVQEAWSAQDVARLRRLSTPEMADVFAEDLAEDSRRGVVNRVSGVKLLQGDLAESWREGETDYATVAMRYALVDVTEDRDTGRLVDGDPAKPIEAVEAWTFARDPRHDWTLSAIQQAA